MVDYILRPLSGLLLCLLVVAFLVYVPHLVRLSRGLIEAAIARRAAAEPSMQADPPSSIETDETAEARAFEAELAEESPVANDVDDAERRLSRSTRQRTSA
ncbi:hypothetical protein [Aeromicrobium sp.]|uniref:hypothetical protein n=1 Tax=Aeromicrobium sp. TaxID=1871063 RepID=UPI003C5BD91D